MVRNCIVIGVLLVAGVANGQECPFSDVASFFAKNVYGELPPKPAKLDFELVEKGEAFYGTAERRQYVVKATDAKGTCAFDVLVYLPKGQGGDALATGSRARIPAFVYPNFMGNHTLTSDLKVRRYTGYALDGAKADYNEKSSRAPVEEIVARGYAFVTYCYSALYSDRTGRFVGNGQECPFSGKTNAQECAFPGSENGHSCPFFSVWSIFDPSVLPEEKLAHPAWCWGGMRVRDLLATLPEIAQDKVAIAGQSRMGKNAVVIGVNDPRYALVCANCGGTKWLRHLPNLKFPAWFSKKMGAWAQNGATGLSSAELAKRAAKLPPPPFEQDAYLGLIAERPFECQGGDALATDGCQGGDALATKRRALMVSAADADRFAPPEESRAVYEAAKKHFDAAGGKIAWHLKKGEHSITAEDWAAFLDFADEVFGYRRGQGVPALANGGDKSSCGQGVPALADAGDKSSCGQGVPALANGGELSSNRQGGDALPTKRPAIDTSADRVATPLDVPLKRLGTLKPRAARAVASSNWRLGCETLDRDFADFDAYKRYVGPLGIKVARLQGGWAKCERKKGVYDFAWLDHIVDELIAQGVEPTIETDYGNSIYKGGGGCDLAGGFPSSEEALAAWDRWIDALTKHFASRVKVWMMWNEPDYSIGHKKTPEAIAAFNVRTAKIVKRNIPDAKIAGLSLANTSPTFLENCLKAMGEDVALLDWIVYHGYEAAPETSYASVEAMKAVAARYAPQAKLWQGENGAPSEWATKFALSQIPWTEHSQAKWDIRRMLGDLGHDVYSSVFTICDFNHIGREINRKGLLRADAWHRVTRVKTAYYAVQNVAALFDDRWTRDKTFDFGDKTLSFYRYVSSENGHSCPFANAQECAFSGKPLLVFWQHKATAEAKDFAIPSDSFAVTLRDFSPVKDRFADPVWIDLLSGRIYKLESLAKVPVYDSPCVVTERAAVDW